ncbi:metal ABC transporter permease [Pseudobdellovibrio sp. HCB154]|uniref:metal ABC transporter permease n=1 Tax=Pseudobdellovibrio sp. HCB154 TaxID=3386277 RepID=UPI003916DD25
MDAIQFLLAPFVMCLLLVVIHCYLGLHVLARGVVFVDLSLAQVASFGATVALLWDPEHESSTGYFIALTGTFIAAAIFAMARRFEKKLPQEALIGITYAFASAAVVLVIDKLAHGAEHLKEALIGQILWVTWSDVLKTFLIYSVVGVIHWKFRDKFLRNSFHSEHGHWFWDFLFYALFGVVITSSTSIAGVLLVFSFLIVPAALSSLFATSIAKRLLFGWLLGAVVSLLGMILSYKLDLPVGAVLVVLLTSLPILAVPVLFLTRSRV